MQPHINHLLHITRLIVQVKDHDELIRLIVQEIKPIFNFHDCGIFVLSEDGLTHVDWAAALPNVAPSQWNDVLATLPQILVHKNSPVEWMISRCEAAGGPVISDFKDLIARFPDYPQFAAGDSFGMLDLGYRDCMANTMRVRGKVIGMFCINALAKDFFDRELLPLFQSITESISVAIGNIMTREVLIQRESENKLLLEISRAISSIDNIVDLLTAIEKLVQPIFDYAEAGVLVLDDDGQFFIDYYALYHQQIPATEESRQRSKKAVDLGYSYIPAKNSLIEYYMHQPPTTGKVMDAKKLNFDAPYLELLLDEDLLYFTCAPLRVSGKSFGLFNIFFRGNQQPYDPRLNFFTQVTDLMAVAIANVLANEKLKKRNAEIEDLNKQLKAQNEYLVEEVEQHYNFEEIVGQNAHFIEVCKTIGLVANTESTVLILGETGTGKELVARAIHKSSSRRNKALIKLNCAALPSTLIESELFGHERGAFTGAVERRIGKFELAHGSTLFLDEVGELPLELQSKLLRALQEREIERLGSNKTISIDVRIIAATNRDLMREVHQGRFRQDLFYRLHIFPITMPPLRQRKEDIPLLAAHFLDRYARETGKVIRGFGKEAMQDLVRYDWPGNIRELEHVIERSVILCKTSIVHELLLPTALKESATPLNNSFMVKPWADQERDYILEVLKVTKGNVKGKGGAAELLQLPPSTLQAKMKKLGIVRKYGHRNSN